MLKKSLKNFTGTLRAQGQGTPPKFSDTRLRVIAEDTDDQNLKFVRDSHRAKLPPDGRTAELKIPPEPIKVCDVCFFRVFRPPPYVHFSIQMLKIL